MRKIIFFCILAAIFSLSKYGQADIQSNTVKIYYADKGLRKLIPMDYVVSSPLPEKQAEEILKNLQSDHGDRILRLIPDDITPIDVKLKKDTIYIDLPAGLSEVLPKNEETEKLIIYQLVNSLTSIEGINSVKFCINGEVCRDFLGFLDMREIFTPDYCI